MYFNFKLKQTEITLSCLFHFTNTKSGCYILFINISDTKFTNRHFRTLMTNVLNRSKSEFDQRIEITGFIIPSFEKSDYITREGCIA